VVEGIEILGVESEQTEAKESYEEADARIKKEFCTQIREEYKKEVGRLCDAFREKDNDFCIDEVCF